MTASEKIIAILTELSDEKVITPESRLTEDLALDSIRMVTLLIELEESFGIVLAESDMNPFDLITVSDVITLVKKYEKEPESNHEKEQN